jgi:O-antigen ligase
VVIGQAIRPAGRREMAEFLLPATLLAAAAIGLLAAIDARYAVAACAALIAVPAAVFKPKLIVYLLIVAIYAGTFQINEVTAQRLAAPLAGIAILSYFVHSRSFALGLDRLTVGIAAAYTLLAVASASWTVSLSGSIYALSSLSISLAFAGVFALLVRGPADLKWMIWLMAIASGLLGLWWADSFHHGTFRGANIAGDPNFYSALQVIALPMIVALAAWSAPLPRLLLYGIAAVTAVSIPASLSRGGMVALLVVLLLLAASPARGLFRTTRRKLAVFAGVAVIIVALVAYAGGDLGDRFAALASDPSGGAGRADLALAATHGFTEHPVVGLGFGGFVPSSFALLRDTPGVFLLAHLRYQDYPGQEVHNTYLESLVELGIPGLLLFLALLGAAARSLVRSARRARAAGDRFIEGVATASLIGLAAFSVSSFTISTETSRALWLLIGLSLALSAMTAPPSVAHDRRPTPIVVHTNNDGDLGS